jgi:tetratricopeptide (TPR) repeat protein
MTRGLKTLLACAIAMSACDAFVCSQQRIKSMELGNKGVSAFQNGLYDTAEHELKLAIQTDPTYDVNYYNLGKVYQKQRKWDKAIESFESAGERAPTNANYQYDLGEAYLETKKLDRAEGALKKATELDEKLYKAHLRLGQVYVALEKPKEADAALRKAIDANARMDKSFVSLGHLYLDYEASKEAAQVFSECVRVNEMSAECHNGHGLALKDNKQFEPATAEFKKALELEPSLTTAIYNAGMTYADWFDQSQSPEHKERAREYLQKYVSSTGSKDSAFGYVKAANDKLYALSGS